MKLLRLDLISIHETLKIQRTYGLSMKPIRRTRSDTTQPKIIEAIKKAGWQVWVIGWPVDLLCWKPSKGFRLLEAKSKRKKDGTAVLKKAQQEQFDFCYLTKTPYVISPEEAIKALESQ